MQFCVISAVIFASLQFINCQQYSFSSQIGNDGSSLRQFFGNPAVQNAFPGFTNQLQTPSSLVSNLANNNNLPLNINNANGSDLQQQFAEIFNWNNDLSNDPRFKACTVPDIGDVSRACPKRAFYFGLNPQHRRAVGMIREILTQPHNAGQTICLAGAMRDLPGMNPNVWIRGMLGAHLSDVGLFDLQVPPMVEVMPHIFLNNDYLQRARRQSQIDPSQRQCIVIDGSSGVDNGIENRLWYFREDIQVNSFHLNWHLIYPFTGIQQRIERSGELFYFTHHGHQARYHAERLANGLPPIRPLDVSTNVVVPEPFNPHLDDVNSGMSWTARQPNAIVQDTVFLNVEGVPPNISVAERAVRVQRVRDAIATQSVLLPDGRYLSINNAQGIDILGHLVEASVFSSNGPYYGAFGVHNEGHVLLAFIEDPQNRTGIPPGVLLEVATAMRDPVFYNYHGHMDNTFDMHKQTLAPYLPLGGELPLQWNGMEITSINLRSDDNGLANTITTFFNQRTFELSRGLDFNRSGVQGPVQACVTHLDHTGFTYEIYVNRDRSAATNRATVRIFLAPRFNENGRRYTMLEQRALFFMMDLFTVELNQIGPNRITRRSIDSSLTIDIPESLLGAGINPRPQREFCGCGWPHHMLVPRGTETGMAFDLFVMLTNGVEDFVPPRNPSPNNECRPAPIYCGRLNDSYPDARPMGYPFDRLPYQLQGGAWWERPRIPKDLDEYVYGIPNMASLQIKIQHVPRAVQPSVAVNGNQIVSSSSNRGVPQLTIPVQEVKQQSVFASVSPVPQIGSELIESVPLLYQEHTNLGNHPDSKEQNHEHNWGYHSHDDSSSHEEYPSTGSAIQNAFHTQSQGFGAYGQQQQPISSSANSYFIGKFSNYALTTTA